MNKLILTEKNNPLTADIDLKDSFEIARLINAEDQKVAFVIEKQLQPIAEAIEAIAQSFQKGGRLAYFGAGTSGRLGVLDASECWPTFGVEHGMVSGYIAGGDKALRYSVENSEDNASFGLSDLADFKPQKGDVIVGISASGNPAYVLAVMQKAQALGCVTIGISSNPEAKMKEFAHIFICTEVGPEVVTGSSRMKSGTAQKMVLNMLSTGAMIRIGKTYHNYMIDVRLKNEKLVQRGIRFVSEICDVDAQTAARALHDSGQSVKKACVMLKRNCTADEAEKLLQNAGGILRKVIS